MRLNIFKNNLGKDQKTITAQEALQIIDQNLTETELVALALATEKLKKNPAKKATVFNLMKSL